jgi:transcriptional regulatory protein GAL4
VPPVVDHPTTYSTLIAQSGLAKIANAIYHEFLSARTANKKVEYQIAEMMTHRLNTWKRSLPAYFESSDVPSWFLGPRAIIIWKEQNLRVLLWRQTEQHHPYVPLKIDAERRCLGAAMETIQSIATYCKSSQSSLHPGIAWYATYYIFEATLVLEASYLSQWDAASEAVPDDRESWEASVATAKGCLEVLAAKNSHSAISCLELIEHIHSSTSIQAGQATMPYEDNSSQSSAGLMHDPFIWTPQMDETVTDPIMRSIIDDTFWGFNFSYPEGSRLASDRGMNRVLEF